MKIIQENFKTENRHIVPMVNSKRIAIEIRERFGPNYHMVNVFVQHRVGSFEEDMKALLSRVEKECKIQLIKSDLKITA